MTTKQHLSKIIHEALTASEIDSLAAELSASPMGRRIAGKAISKGKRNLSDELRESKRQRMIERNQARKNKGQV